MTAYAVFLRAGRTKQERTRSSEEVSIEHSLYTCFSSAASCGGAFLTLLCVSM